MFKALKKKAEISSENCEHLSVSQEELGNTLLNLLPP